MRRLLLAATLIATPLSAENYTLGNLLIEHPVAYETPKVARSGGGYLSITNSGSEADRLLEVRSAYPQTMIHRSSVDENGVASMEHLMSLDIPAGETVVMAPGGLHIMFMGLNGKPLEAGKQVPATLVFEHAGEIEVVFDVEKRNQGGTTTDQ